MLLKVEHLNVFFKGKHVLKDVSFDVERNEIFSIVGESGSGKSTIAKAIMGLIPYQGIIERSAKDIFMIFQDPGNYLDPLFNVYSQIIMVKEAVKESAGMDIDKAINLVGLDVEELKRKYPHQLSGGQKQRVMIAMSLARGSSLVIADEPTSSLDVLIQKDVLCAFKNMKDYFSSVVITHDIDVVYYIADRVMVLKDGVVQEISKKDDFFKSPKSEYGRRLLESFY
ncbi:MAG: ATP-binding cassette domain-containing protein [Hydrogenobaculum sp.]|nr:ABC transporter ATP-binding protein [Hydrogenobaculum sp.]